MTRTKQTTQEQASLDSIDLPEGVDLHPVTDGVQIDVAGVSCCRLHDTGLEWLREVGAERWRAVGRAILALTGMESAA